MILYTQLCTKMHNWPLTIRIEHPSKKLVLELTPNHPSYRLVGEYESLFCVEIHKRWFLEPGAPGNDFGEHCMNCNYASCDWMMLGLWMIKFLKDNEYHWEFWIALWRTGLRDQKCFLSKNGHGIQR